MHGRVSISKLKKKRLDYAEVLVQFSNFQNMDYEVDNLEYMNKKKRHTSESMSVGQTRPGDWKSGKASRDCARYSMYVDCKFDLFSIPLLNVLTLLSVSKGTWISRRSGGSSG